MQTNVWIANDPSTYAPMLFFLGHFKPYNMIVFSFRNIITWVYVFPFRSATLQFVSGFYNFIRCHELSFVVLLITCLFILKKDGRFKFEIEFELNLG